MILSILTAPSKKLYRRAKKIEKIDQKIKKLAQDMRQTLQANFGVGLAAPQVGESIRLITVGAQKEIPQTTLINPKIIKLSKEKEDFEESCLSIPGLAGMVNRPKKVELAAQNLKGQKLKLTAKGLFARVIQHEIDHLDGILFSDKVTDFKTFKKVPLPYKIVFLGTPDFSVPILQGLIKAGWGISLVITEPDKPVGRKQILTPPPVKKLSLKQNLLIYQPESLSSIVYSLSSLKPDLIILAAYGRIIPKEILDIPKYGCICLHPSLLPKYRGASPIQFTILNGEKKTGVTIFKMDEKIDHGPIIANSKFEIRNSKITTKELSQELAKLATELLIKTLPLYLEGKIKPKSQEHKKASYTRMLKKEDGRIENSKLKTKNLKLLQEIERKIRAFYPWPKVWTVVNGKRVIIHKANIEKSQPKAGPPRAEKINLILDIVQPEGKKPMSYEEYLKGNPKIA